MSRHAKEEVIVRWTAAEDHPALLKLAATLQPRSAERLVRALRYQYSVLAEHQGEPIGFAIFYAVDQRAYLSVIDARGPFSEQTRDRLCEFVSAQVAQVGIHELVVPENLLRRAAS